MYLKKDIFGKIKGIVQEDSKLNKNGVFVKEVAYNNPIYSCH